MRYSIFYLFLFFFIMSGYAYSRVTNSTIYFKSETCYIDIIHNITDPVFSIWDSDIIVTHNTIQYSLTQNLRIDLNWDYFYSDFFYSSNIHSNTIHLHSRTGQQALGIKWNMDNNNSLSVKTGMWWGKLRFFTLHFESKHPDDFGYSYTLKRHFIHSEFGLYFTNTAFFGIQETSVNYHQIKFEIPIGNGFIIKPHASLSLIQSSRSNTNILLINGAIYQMGLNLKYDLSSKSFYLNYEVNIPDGGPDFQTMSSSYLKENRYFYGNLNVNLPSHSIKLGLQFDFGLEVYERFLWGNLNSGFIIKPEEYWGNAKMQGMIFSNIKANWFFIQYLAIKNNGFNIKFTLNAIHIIPHEPNIYITQGWILGNDYAEYEWINPINILHLYIPGITLVYTTEKFSIKYGFQQIIPYITYISPEYMPAPVSDQDLSDKFYGGGMHSLCVEFVY